MPSTRRPARLILESHLGFFLIGSLFLCACTSAKPTERKDSIAKTSETQATPASSQTTANDPAKSAGSPMPTLADINAAVQRVYLETIEIDANRSASFFLGDFNGDGSQDLAVVARPTKGALPKLNSDYANWIVEDPRKIVLPDPTKAVQKLPKPPARETIQQDDLLLVILHGYQQEGWHHEYARQTFLLKNSVGENMRVQSLKEFSKAAGEKNGLLPPSGDVINEKLSDHDGFLYWTHGKYVWRQ
jgi:hypothetical protein